MSTWGTRACKIFLFGIPTVSTVGYFTRQQLFADEKILPVNDVIRIDKDVISPIPPKSLVKPEEIDPKLTLIQAVRHCRNLVQQTLTINGYPGIVVGVSIKGKPIWVQGFGFANVEAGAKCNKDTVMRIASISKPLTMLAVAKLVEEGKIDLDKSIYSYLNDKWPVKRVNGIRVDINIRQLASHLAGIRHYKDESEKVKIFRNYTKAVDALETFKDDDLVAEPGTKFNYSTFGYTLIAAAVESILPDHQTFGDYLIYDICRRRLGMMNTYLDENQSIIANRAVQYRRDKEQLKNSPYVDCSYKYAGGGFLSTIPDLLRFGNIMMYSYLPHLSKLPGFLKKSTVDELWTPIPIGQLRFSPGLSEFCKYGLGWGLIRDAQPVYSHGNSPPFRDIIFHTGAATGGTSLLMIVPEKEMVISLLCNVEWARGLMQLGMQLAETFANTVPIQRNNDESTKSDEKLNHFDHN